VNVGEKNVSIFLVHKKKVEKNLTDSRGGQVYCKCVCVWVELIKYLTVHSGANFCPSLCSQITIISARLPSGRRKRAE
jgi:hypothetical protein